MNIFRNHPTGLVILFLTEMWERFSYYGMRALLIYYLTRHFLFSDSEAYVLYGSYTAMVYAMPVLGGLIADRYFGGRKAITLGALLLTLGHFTMAFEGDAAIRDLQGNLFRDETALQVLYLAMALIAVGVGLLKPNISTLVGKLYPLNDPRRDGAFTLFYMGINLGAMSATLLCGWLGETYGWPYGFGAAGIGMLLGLAVFLSGQRHLLNHAEPPNPEQLKAPGRWWLSQEQWLWFGILVSVVIVWRALQYDWLIQGFLAWTAVSCVFGLVIFTLLRCSKQERANMLVMLLLIVYSVLFWSLFEQAGTSMSLFTERNLDKDLLGLTVQPSQFQSLNPAFIILLAPLFAWGWQKLAALNIEPSMPAKFGLGIIQVGLGFYALVIGAANADGNGQVAIIWLILAYLLHTTGELCVSPVGLAMVTRLSVQRITGLVMGVWFLSSAFAANLGALIARATSLDTGGGERASGVAAVQIYGEFFNSLAGMAALAGVLLLLISPWLARRIHLQETAERPVQQERKSLPG